MKRFFLSVQQTLASRRRCLPPHARQSPADFMLRGLVRWRKIAGATLTPVRQRQISAMLPLCQGRQCSVSHSVSLAWLNDKVLEQLETAPACPARLKRSLPILRSDKISENEKKRASPLIFVSDRFPAPGQYHHSIFLQSGPPNWEMISRAILGFALVILIGYFQSLFLMNSTSSTRLLPRARAWLNPFPLLLPCGSGVQGQRSVDRRIVVQRPVSEAGCIRGNKRALLDLRDGWSRYRLASTTAKLTILIQDSICFLVGCLCAITCTLPSHPETVYPVPGRSYRRRALLSRSYTLCQCLPGHICHCRRKIIFPVHSSGTGTSLIFFQLSKILSVFSSFLSYVHAKKKREKMVRPKSRHRRYHYFQNLLFDVHA